ncbi:GNAT family N-acetyltransferase [Piscirickettsia litoralis]|uniref:N-acetyltransferase domain-containing protein n=1 Tax=Piscirickettsia litoralis TaxID=1891921 RepID=A0ABX2ZYL2_9GAMM|nr:N-acetyltransferase [Piscirickettsia litoralis]ODN41704.1 hypothetical protein BGC07_00285 [Piscirickettsia litoralis]
MNKKKQRKTDGNYCKFFQQPKDNDSIINVNKLAFKTGYEAKLVNALVDSEVDTISFVAKKEGDVVGHLLLSRMSVKNGDNALGLKIFGLAPMAVIPTKQKQGIGKALIEKAVATAKDENIDAIFVLGHPQYYPKFKFIPTSDWNITCQYDVPNEVFMALDISGGLSKIKGKTVLYSDIFGKI